MVTPGPMPDRSFSKEFFPNIQFKPPLAQLEAQAALRAALPAPFLARSQAEGSHCSPVDPQ